MFPPPFFFVLFNATFINFFFDPEPPQQVISVSLTYTRVCGSYKKLIGLMGKHFVRYELQGAM